MNRRRMIVRNRRARSNNDNGDGQTEVILPGVLGQVMYLSLNASGSPQLAVYWEAVLAKELKTSVEADPCAEGWQEDGVPIFEVEYVRVEDEK